MKYNIQFREIVSKENPASPMRHASTLMQLSNGDLLCAWFGGTFELEPDTDIWLARRSNSGIWTTPERVSCEPNTPHCNPVLSKRKNGDLVLFYKVGFEIEKWKTFKRVSKDNGFNWGPSSELVPGDEGGRGPVRNKIHIDSQDIWIAGASLEKGQSWTAFADISPDEGHTWYESNNLQIELEPSAAEKTGNVHIEVTEQSFKGRGVIQPTIWEDMNGLHMLLRSTEGWIYRSDSQDGGKSWAKPHKTNMPNNNSGIDILSLPAGDLFLVHNPVVGNWAERTPLVISHSDDGGSNWSLFLTLSEGPGEFSYPAIIQVEGGFIVSWTINRREIGVTKIQLE